MAESWLNKARRFRDYAKEDLTAGNSAAFFAQQAAELLSKGVLIAKTGSGLTHSVSELLHYLAKAFGEEPSEEVARCAESLEQHYVQARCPDARVNDYRKWEAEEEVKCMEISGPMFNKWLECVKELAEERERRFNALLQRLCQSSLAVVLFGSRARGDHTPLSDWDILVLTETGHYRVEAGELGQIFWLPIDEVDRVLDFSMVLLDAVMEGKLLCGSGEAFAKVRDRVEAYVKSRGLVKTKSGWIRKDLL